MAGAAAQGFDAVFVAGGIHSEELATDAWDRGDAPGVRTRLNAVSGLRVAGILTALKW